MDKDLKQLAQSAAHLQAMCDFSMILELKRAIEQTLGRKITFDQFVEFFEMIEKNKTTTEALMAVLSA